MCNTRKLTGALYYTYMHGRHPHALRERKILRRHIAPHRRRGRHLATAAAATHGRTPRRAPPPRCCRVSSQSPPLWRSSVRGGRSAGMPRCGVGWFPVPAPHDRTSGGELSHACRPGRRCASYATCAAGTGAHDCELYRATSRWGAAAAAASPRRCCRRPTGIAGRSDCRDRRSAPPGSACSTGTRRAPRQSAAAAAEGVHRTRRFCRYRGAALEVGTDPIRRPHAESRRRGRRTPWRGGPSTERGSS